jgi:hypothetical protein
MENEKEKYLALINSIGDPHTLLQPTQ